jgi:16S rRNA processing protein RimM
MEPGAELIVIGRVTRPQGRRGEVRVEPLTDDALRFRDLRECHLVAPDAGGPSGGEPRSVEQVWFQGTVPVLKFRGVETIDQAEAIRGRLVSVPRGATRPLPPDRFYGFDLVGATVTDPGGIVLGTLADVLAGSAQDLWVVEMGGRQCLVPAVHAIVERVDPVGRVVVIRPPEGLLELAEAPAGGREARRA